MTRIKASEEIKPKALEKILNLLTEPQQVWVYLSNFNIESILNQANELGYKLKDTNEMIFELRNPTKKEIIELYTKEYEIKHPEYLESLREAKDSTTSAMGKEYYHKQIREEGIINLEARIVHPRISLNKARWLINYPNSSIELTPYGIEIEYREKKLPLFSKIKRILDGTGSYFDITKLQRNN